LDDGNTGKPHKAIEKSRSPSAANKPGPNIVDHHPFNDDKHHRNKKQNTLNDFFVIQPLVTWLFQRRDNGEHE
jgi:hypothetical protein